MTQTLIRTDRTNTRFKRSLRRQEVIERHDPVAATYDDFGQRLYLVASVLTDDTDLAERLVIQTILAYESEPSTLQELSAGIYIAWMAWGSPPLSDESFVMSGTGTGIMHEIRKLAADQRAALGLCKYGRHTYRSAADVLGLAPECVARLLLEALRALALQGGPTRGSPAA